MSTSSVDIINDFKLAIYKVEDRVWISKKKGLFLKGCTKLIGLLHYFKIKNHVSSYLFIARSVNRRLVYRL